MPAGKTVHSVGVANAKDASVAANSATQFFVQANRQPPAESDLFGWRAVLTRARIAQRNFTSGVCVSIIDEVGSAATLGV